MKIYRLDVNKVQEPTGAVFSSYISPRTTQKSVYYLKESDAKAKQLEIYEGMQKLVGFLTGFEAIITTIEVVE